MPIPLKPPGISLESHFASLEDVIQDQTVLITGFRGMIGSAVAARLASAGWNVLSCGGSAKLDLSTEGCDLCSLFPRPDVVVHLAAAVPNRATVIDNAHTAARTRRIDTTVAEACAGWDLPVIYASGTSLYDPFDASQKSEDSVVQARSPYLQAKLDGERQLLDRCRTTVLRVSAPVGPGLNPQLVFMKYLNAALAGGSLQYWGNGSREQDFICTEDLADLVVAVLRQPIRGIFNAASGKPVTMRTLAETIVAIVGAGTVVAGGQPDPQEGASARYDIGRALATYKWAPNIDLDGLVQKMASISS
jgi:UDP-glucose 4-epimerase